MANADISNQVENVHLSLLNQKLDVKIPSGLVLDLNARMFASRQPALQIKIATNMEFARKLSKMLRLLIDLIYLIVSKYHKYLIIMNNYMI